MRRCRKWALAAWRRRPLPPASPRPTGWRPTGTPAAPRRRRLAALACAPSAPGAGNRQRRGESRPVPPYAPKSAPMHL